MSGDRGSASLWLLAVGLMLLAAGLAGAAIGDAQLARHRAQSAADLGVLAGAARAHYGAELACARAEELIFANGGVLRECRLVGLELTVTVEVVATVAGRPATAVARAGPLQSAPGPYPDAAGAG
ncbi:Rv3654c family TadE-like protein [Natronosporangium hydrolyticum]|uniref:Rv3654c family TadE-like protein n=1 Tax=Natronosporangium hydrolyticum TaxID=2811111 RepID=UPI001EFA0E03|nr:Rv3654c family TadE-like protein [Natronosporangium hydrolyticum]